MIYISKELESVIRKEAEKSYPNECCGILYGMEDSDVKKIEQTIPINNSFEDGEQYHRFLITPEDMMKAELHARKLKLDILGFYHSHPDHPAMPSEYDRNHALPFYSYIITEVNNGISGNFTSWELSEDRSVFIPESITNHK